jgi:hypothetical protein
MTTNVDPIQALRDTKHTQVDIATFLAPARDPAKPWMVYGAGCAIDVAEFDAEVIQRWRNEGVLSANHSVAIPEPEISDVSANATADTAEITWTTDMEASSQVHYGADASYGTSSALADTDPGVTSHTVLLEGLTPETLYHYSAASASANSETSTSPDATFTTTTAP